MIPDPGEVLRRRATAAMIVRIGALVPVFAATAVTAIWTYEANTNRLWFEEHAAFAIPTLVFVLLAGAMWFLAPWQARKAVKMPKSIRCPACNYKIIGLTEARCPECGLPLTSEFVAKPGEKTPPPRDPDRATLRQISTTVLRLIAVVLAVISTPFLVYFSVEFIYASTGPSRYFDLDEWIEPLAVFGFMFVAAIFFFAFGRRLSAVVVPTREKVGGPPEPPLISVGASALAKPAQPEATPTESAAPETAR